MNDNNKRCKYVYQTMLGDYMCELHTNYEEKVYCDGYPKDCSDYNESTECVKNGPPEGPNATQSVNITEKEIEKMIYFKLTDQCLHLINRVKLSEELAKAIFNRLGKVDTITFTGSTKELKKSIDELNKAIKSGELSSILGKAEKPDYIVTINMTKTKHDMELKIPERFKGKIIDLIIKEKAKG